MKALTPKQQKVYDCIKSHILATGMPPTRAEIAKQLGFKSPNAAEEHLKALQKKEAIEMLAGTSRGIKLLAEEPEDLGLPLIGQVAAGQPITAIEHIEDHYKLDSSMFKPNADFLLRVRGDSMQDIGILDGDLLAVHKTIQVNNGDVVVARVDDDVTVKRFEKIGNKVLLHAENPAYSPIEVDLSTEYFTVEGLAVGVIRNNRLN